MALTLGVVRGNERGIPLIDTFTVRDYGEHNQTWVAVQDRAGRLYVGNRDLVLEWDGQSWTSIPTGGLFVRALAVDADDRIWVGGVGEIGYLESNAIAGRDYVSLREHLPSEDRGTLIIIEATALSHGVYFGSAKGLEGNFLLGTVSRQPGLFLARQVRQPDGAAAGVVVVKVQFDALEAQWGRSADRAFVTGDRGVVLITSVPEWRFLTLSAQSETERAATRDILQLDADLPLDPLPLTFEQGGQRTATETGSIDRPEFVVSRIDTAAAGWTLHVLAAASTVDPHEQHWDQDPTRAAGGTDIDFEVAELRLRTIDPGTVAAAILARKWRNFRLSPNLMPAFRSKLKPMLSSARTH